MTLHPSDAYAAGVKAAMDEFGLNRRMPEGPGHLGAERLARMLGEQQETHATRGAAPRRSVKDRLERPTHWGDKAPLGSGSLATEGLSGASPFGGV